MNYAENHWICNFEAVFLIGNLLFAQEFLRFGFEDDPEEFDSMVSRQCWLNSKEFTRSIGWRHDGQCVYVFLYFTFDR